MITPTHELIVLIDEYIYFHWDMKHPYQSSKQLAEKVLRFLHPLVFEDEPDMCATF